MRCWGMMPNMGTEGDTCRVVAGRYRLQQRIGRGGMGIVWRAHDTLLGRQVAVKEIVLDEGLDPQDARERRELTLREARAAAQLRHPHVVVVHDVVEDRHRENGEHGGPRGNGAAPEPGGPEEVQQGPQEDGRPGHGPRAYEDDHGNHGSNSGYRYGNYDSGYDDVHDNCRPGCGGSVRDASPSGGNSHPCDESGPVVVPPPSGLPAPEPSVRYEEFGAEIERLYLVMELVEGGSLAQRIFDEGPVGPHEAARIALALLGALRTAHAAGVLHRDLKPANVLVESATGRVVLTDFGIAHVNGTTTLTEAGSFVGSPEYTAPERISGSGTGPECDLWSLGALLCAVLSGESPFHRDSLGGILHAVVTADIRPPEQAGPLLPVVQGLLEREPARRMTAATAERLLRLYLHTGRIPDPGHPGGLRAAARALRLHGGRHDPQRDDDHDVQADYAHDCAYDDGYAYDDSYAYDSSAEDHSLRARTPGGPAAEETRPRGHHAPSPSRAGRSGDGSEARDSAAAGRQGRALVVGAVLAAAVAGAGVSAAALLLGADADSPGTPGSSAPDSTPDGEPGPTVTVTETTSRGSTPSPSRTDSRSGASSPSSTSSFTGTPSSSPSATASSGVSPPAPVGDRSAPPDPAVAPAAATRPALDGSREGRDTRGSLGPDEEAPREH